MVELDPETRKEVKGKGAPFRSWVDQPLWRWLGAVMLVALVWLLLSSLPLPLPPIVRAILVACVLFLLPGYLLHRALFRQSGWRGLNLLPIAFGLSLGLGAVAWGGAAILGGSLETLAYLLAGFNTVIIAWSAIIHSPKGEGSQPAASPAVCHVVWSVLLVLGVIAFWLFVALSWGALYMAESDTWYYLSIVRRIAQTQSLAPGDPYFLGVADPQRGGPWVALVALLVNLSEISITAIWDGVLVLLIPIAILANYLVADTFFRDRWAAALSCLFLLYGFGRATWDVPMAVVTPAGVGFILFLATLALAWRYVHDGNKWVLLLAIVIAWALASIHLLVFAGLLLALLSFALLHFAVHRQRIPLCRLLLLTMIPALLAVPFLRTWAGSGPQTANSIYADEWGLLAEFHGWHIMKPGALVGGTPSPWEWAFLLAPALLVLARRRTWALFLLSTMLFVVATAFNPLFIEAMLHWRLIPPWGIWRLDLQVFQFQFVLGGLGAIALGWLFHKIRQEWAGGRTVAVALLVGSIGLAFLPSAVPLVKPLWGYVSGSLQSLERRAAVFPFNWEDGIRFLSDRLPPGSVILADSNTSFFISALTDQYVVSIPYGHSSPLVNDDEQRRQDAAQALDPDTEMGKVLCILDQYQVDYIVLVLNLPPTGAYSLSPEAFARLVARFEDDPLHFERFFSDEADPTRQTAIFRYDPAGGMN